MPVLPPAVSLPPAHSFTAEVLLAAELPSGGQENQSGAARPFRPRDKPRAEFTVLLVCRWVLAHLRHQRFFSLDELNGTIRPLLTDLNDRPFQKLPGSRRSAFESLDRPAMRALPTTPYVYAEWKRYRPLSTHCRPS
jgi:hypothetical protein